MQIYNIYMEYLKWRVILQNLLQWSYQQVSHNTTITVYCYQLFIRLWKKNCTFKSYFRHQLNPPHIFPGFSKPKKWVWSMAATIFQKRKTNTNSILQKSFSVNPKRLCFYSYFADICLKAFLFKNRSVYSSKLTCINRYSCHLLAKHNKTQYIIIIKNVLKY